MSEISEECVGCGDCVDSCGFAALSLDEDEEKAVVDNEKCMGCGVCVDKCPTEAVNLRLEPSKGEPLDLAALMQQE
ncbi:MAG: 4Fe-4S dicluster domain-containing protein [Deltaproteobacteria bacterium]|nr:4Fe-4S dicluster domain-containing protein [Deltaproteobacteria bacterium]